MISAKNPQKRMDVFSCILLIIFITHYLPAKEMSNTKEIALIPIGNVDLTVIKKLRDDLRIIFKKKITAGRSMPQPDYAYNERRNQYLSTAILRKIMKEKDYTQYEKVLGIVECDLYVPELNFVFGEAGRKAAVISLTRLRQEFYGLPEDKNLLYKRALTEAVHELGHTYSLSHCSNPKCVMFFSNSLIDTDRKEYQFCTDCKAKLR